MPVVRLRNGEKIKKFFDVYVPIENCNLRCDYCYITQQRLFDNTKAEFRYSAQHIGKALSQQRLGGICHFNFCGGGETLAPKEIVGIIREILVQGHYIFVVTNGTMFNRFEEFMEFPAELKNRLGFKMSFHYLELKRLDIMQKWFDNINKIRNAQMSFSVEITPTDELIPHIDDIKKICLENVGALPHITVTRDNTKKDLPILTKLSREEYEKTWGDGFDTPMNHFKMRTFNVKRKEFCYAGAWSGYFNIGTGNMVQCYTSYKSQNIFEDLDRPIEFIPVGHNCNQPHCYNSHAFLTLGLIPEMETPAYSQIRDRTCLGKTTYTHWLTDSMREFISKKLYDENMQLSEKEQMFADRYIKKQKKTSFFNRILRKTYYTPPIKLVNIYSSVDSTVAKAYFHSAKADAPMPLVVELHEWSCDYKTFLKRPQLGILCKNAGYNYIYPDFRGSNDNPESCVSEKAICDIDDAIGYSIKNGNVDENNIVIIGVSGGGHAVLTMYLKSKYNIKYFSSWSPISDIEQWYYQTKYAKLKYCKDIEQIVGGSKNIQEMRNRSPVYMDFAENVDRKNTKLEIYHGINDGYAGSVPSVHSLNFYNKICKSHENLISSSEIIQIITRSISPQSEEFIADRKLLFKKGCQNTSVFIFDGAHEILIEYAFERISKILYGCEVV